MAPHSRRELLLAVFGAVVAAASLLWWLNHYRAGQTLVAVVAARRSLAAHQRLTAQDVMMRPFSRAAIPAGAFTETSEVIGAGLVHPLTEGEIILPHAMAAGDPNSPAALVPAGRVGFLLPVGWLAAGIPRVKRGDQISFYSVIPTAQRAPRGGATTVGILLAHVPVLAVNEESDSPATLLLALSSHGLGRLLEARAAGYFTVAVAESGSGGPGAVSSSPW